MTQSASSAEAPPTCYRHPGRETYVRCNRCERPICPDCMLDAAVGFQCPECVREGNKSVRQRRTAFGGLVGAGGYVTRTLIAINVIAFLVQLAEPEFTERFAMVSVFVADGEPYRLITAAFLHSTSFLLHIAFNMYALFMFGTLVEQALGRLRYTGLYLLSALGGSTLSYLLHPAVEVANGVPQLFAGVGASGAVFGLFGAYFVIAKRLRADTSQIVGLIVVNLIIGFSFAGQIDNWAHIGGLATGAALTWTLARAPRERRDLIQLVAFAGIAVLIVGVVAARTPAVREQTREHFGVSGLRRAPAAAPVR